MALSKKVQRSLDPNNKVCFKVSNYVNLLSRTTISDLELSFISFPKHWAHDTSRFGYKLLQKYGWSDGKGLGANLDGITSHIKVVQKADTKGSFQKSFNHEFRVSTTSCSRERLH
jgi:hypothetical protein